MANSKFEYVKQFESESRILNNCWFVVRIDGRGFTKFTEEHDFIKPNDIRGIDLMNDAAISVMKEFKDIVIAFGESDEYSFVFKRDTDLWNRRSEKILSSVVSLFSASYIMNWSTHFPQTTLKRIPMFDGRIVCYPTNKNIRDYLSWRQVDCHINNLYNTTFWTLVKEIEDNEIDGSNETKKQRSARARAEVQKTLLPTFSADKNEILFQRGVNYNNLPEVFKKGSILVREISKRQQNRALKKSSEHTFSINEQIAMRDELRRIKLENKAEKELKKHTNSELNRLEQTQINMGDGVSLLHVDLVDDKFWSERSYVMGDLDAL